MTIETKLRAGITMSILGLIMAIFAYFQQQDELQKCYIESQRLMEQKDSLEVELNVQIMVAGEYSYNWDIFHQINPSLADSIDNQTE